MDQRVTQYETFKDHLQVLKDKMLVVVELDDAFEGQGAEAIKGFFSAQCEVVDSWIHFVEIQLAFMQDVGAMGDDRELGGQTHVDLPFLEQDLSNAHTRMTEMVQQQHEDLSSILSGISDLVSLQAYSPQPVELAIEDAKQKRLDTVEKVEEYDQALVDEYAVSEDAQLLVQALFTAMMDATRQNGEYTPIAFNAQEFKSSDVYQVKDEVKQGGIEYVEYKQEQQDVREAMAKQAELDARPWYEKAWDTTTVFVGEISGYYDSKRAATGIDPVTGEELTPAQRVTAGALAAAGFIPVVGWTGRLVKGGKAVYNTTKGANAATQGLDAFKASKSLSSLEKAEFGLYGLVSANGMSEYIIGRDLMGNELTDEQRNASLLQSTLLLGGNAYLLKGSGNGMAQNVMPTKPPGNVTTNAGRTLDPKVVDEILSTNKGLRPDPSTYLPQEYITNHLAKFDSGATKIASSAPTRPLLGPPGGTFVMPNSVTNDLIARSNGDVAKLEDLLSLERGTLGDSPVRLDINNPPGLRMPDGNELGANNQWVPGGYTGGGIPEATIDQLPIDQLTVTELFK